MPSSGLSFMWPWYQIVISITIVLNAIPIPAHWRAGNVATISMGLWNLLFQIVTMVGTIVWHGNINNEHPVWGDIVAFIQAAWPTAIASTAFCIQYRLWSIARAKSVFVTKRDKKRQGYVTLALCIGLPLFIGALHYVVQGHRYNIYEDVGPVTETYITPVAFVLWYAVDPTICVITAVFAAMTIHLILARRKEFDAVLASGSSNVNRDKYIRLLSLAGVSIAVHLPFSIWAISQTIVIGPISPWISWDDTHSNYLRIGYYSRKFMDLYPAAATSWTTYLWSIPLTGGLYFVFFGFGEEATSQYKKVIGACLRPLGIEYPKKRRRTAKRTWLDVLLRRPGKPTNLNSSVQSSTMPQFASDPSTSRPSHNPSSTANPTRTQTSTGGASNDLHLDLSNLDFLDQAEARKQARISAYTRPGQAMRTPVTPKGRAAPPPQRESFSSSIHPSSEDVESKQPFEDDESRDISDEKRDRVAELPSKPESSSKPRAVDDEEVDLEAQEQVKEADRLERKRIWLEQHPELTEEVTF